MTLFPGIGLSWFTCKCKYSKRSGSFGGVLNWGSKGCCFEPHHRPSHCAVSLSKTLFQLLSTGLTQEDPSWHDWKIVDCDVKNQLNQNKNIRSRGYRIFFFMLNSTEHDITTVHTGPRSAVSNVSGYRCVSDCRSRGREFDPGPVPYFRGDWSWNNFYGHSPPFRWFIQEGLLSVTSESMCTNYWLTACSSLPRKKCG